MTAEVLVLKLDPSGKETWRYKGEILERTPKSVLIEAFFNRDDLPFHGIVLGRGDRFLEKYFSDRWFNIFEIHDRADDHVKGWYCNLTRPAVITDDQISYMDLALDLLVYPDGKQLVLDQEEFAALHLPETERKQVNSALRELQRLFQNTPINLHSLR